MAKDAAAVAALLRKPLAFLSTNLVIPLNAPDQSGLLSFSLHDDLGPARLSNRTPIPAYSLRPGDGGAACFNAYWCAFAPNGTKIVVVGRDADLMFSAEMTGCSLGVGSRTDTGHRLISHANSMQVGEDVSADLADLPDALRISSSEHCQQWSQYQRVTELYPQDPNLRVIEPSSYRPNPLAPNDHLLATPFGIRDPGADDWAFYMQKRGSSRMDQELVGVVFVAGVPPVTRKTSNYVHRWVML